MKAVLVSGFLFIYCTCFAQTNTQLPPLKTNNYKGELIGGSCVLAVGAGLIGFGVHLNGITELHGTHFGQTWEEKPYSGQAAVALALGTLGAGSGIFFITKGLIGRRKHLQGISLTPNSLSISLRI